MENLTYNDLPQAVFCLAQEVGEIKRLLLLQGNKSAPETDRWFDLAELVEYDPEKRSIPTFYGYVHGKTIPYHKRGKKLIFLKSEIDDWLKAGRKKTVEEIKAEAAQYVKEKGVRNGRASDVFGSESRSNKKRG